jgi:pheromone a factor receptor
MGFAHPELLIPSIFALVLALYPAPWHIRTRNVATLSMIFWMTSLNLVHIVNCEWPLARVSPADIPVGIVWSDNAKTRAKVWCDIAAAINGKRIP